MGERIAVIALALLLLFPFDYFTPKAQAAGQKPVETPDSVVNLDAEMLVRVPEQTDSIAPTMVVSDDYPYGLDGKKIFNPSPTRAVWMSALFPGLGQIYNRRYWKLPIVVGGFMGLAYATNWNSSQYQDYMQGYRDITDSDPSTKSYMDFFPPTTKESDLDTAWLTRTFKSRKDYFRRNRDLCIICIVALYLVCALDAYVDASLAHFDISEDLSVDWSPTLMMHPVTHKPQVGLNWAFTF